MKEKSDRYFNRELSWLAFNHRVLQEARDPGVPLYERLKFLAIFSSNLDEFFRVRVASLKALLNLKKKAKKKLEIDPADLLRTIKGSVQRLQEEFGSVFRNQVLRELNEHGIFLINETEMDEEQRLFASRYFHERVEPLVAPMFLGRNKEAPFLQNKSLYLITKLLPKSIPPVRDGEPGGEDEYRYAVMEIPSQQLPRFVTLPKTDGRRCIMFLDDIIRFCLPQVFPNHEVLANYSIKLTRDAELYIEDEFTGDLLEKIKTGLRKRATGVASRFLYDSEMPKSLLKLLRATFALSKEDLVPGARYHNLNDFFSFPDPEVPHLTYQPLPPLRHCRIGPPGSIFESIRRGDSLLHFPYQSFGYVCQFLQESANDPSVTSIQITLYRVAADSKVVRSLIDAAIHGKSVTAFVEVKARFDEESNIRWAEEMERAGVRVLYSLPGLKVHAKICLVCRTEPGRKGRYLYLSTGNFNEKTARSYCDIGYFTADERLANDAQRVFEFLEDNKKTPSCDHLIIAPFKMREEIFDLIDNEIKLARKNRVGQMTLKMNSLEDRKVIDKLYDASRAGVKIRIIVRGICCLVPGIEGLSENIRVVSIVDRFLEHARIYIFHNGGDERFFASSADLMTRNLCRRIELMFPIADDHLKSELRKIVDLQLHDNVKARIIDKDQTNRYKRSRVDDHPGPQVAEYELLKQIHERTTLQGGEHQAGQ